MPPMPISLFDNIPTLVWTGVISSAITLFGVLVADWRNTVRQKRQHDFDAEQKRLERTLAFRQEIYVPVLDVLSEVVVFAVSMADLKFDEHKLVEEGGVVGPMDKLNASIAKITLISEASTAVVADELGRLFTKTHAALSDASEPYKTAQMECYAAELSKTQLDVQFQRVSNLLDSRHESGAKKDEGWRALLSQQEKYYTAVTEAEKKWSTLVAAEGLEKLKYLRKVYEHAPALEALMLELVAAMRAELMYTSDSTALTAEFHHKRKLARGDLNASFDKAQERLGAQPTPNA